MLNKFWQEKECQMTSRKCANTYTRKLYSLEKNSKEKEVPRILKNSVPTPKKWIKLEK